MSSPLVLFKTTIGLLTVIFSTSLPKTSAVLYEDALERVYFAPRARDVQYLSLSGINSLNYDNVTEAYIKVLEGSQLVASLKNQMGKRLNETVPPPHHHCFISERNLTHLHTLNHNSTQALRCDHYLLSSFPSALDRAIIYEGVRFHNTETRVMMKIKNMVVNIQMVLSNFTGLVLNETSEMGLEDALACEAYDVATPPACNAREERSTEEVEVEEEEGESEQTGQLTRSSSSVSSSEQQGEQEGTGSLRRARSVEDPTDADNLDLAYYEFSDYTTDSPTGEDATPTATTPTRCSVIEDDDDQFIYITELWVALHYLKLDLQQQRNCLRADA